MENLWNLKDVDKSISNTPNLILEEQAKYFGKSIKDDILYAKITNARLKNHPEMEYKLATNFSIISPALDNYTYSLFTVYSNPESNYPVAIDVNDDKDYIEAKYICNDEASFIKALSEILSSEKTSEVISVLYSKSKNY